MASSLAQNLDDVCNQRCSKGRERGGLQIATFEKVGILSPVFAPRA